MNDGEIEEQEDEINKEQNNMCALSDTTGPTGNEHTFSYKHPIRRNKAFQMKYDKQHVL